MSIRGVQHLNPSTAVLAPYDAHARLMPKLTAALNAIHHRPSMTPGLSVNEHQ